MPWPALTAATIDVGEQLAPLSRLGLFAKRILPGEKNLREEFL